ncbi:hypothetical protein [Cupriavidus sp. UME77]|uniref:hypothetical protein n=1 Tax=Cupriavidus sp. UME77 TaxID=1862321 RepID=UPI001600B63F|nr:hypothetical protein [Cupriavidus sp. UME77]
MQIEIKLRSNIFADEDAPAEAKAAFRDAVRDRSTLFAVQRACFALTRLVDEGARDSLLSDATLASLASGNSVSEELRVIELRLLAQAEHVRAATNFSESIVRPQRIGTPAGERTT